VMEETAVFVQYST